MTDRPLTEQLRTHVRTIEKAAPFAVQVTRASAITATMRQAAKRLGALKAENRALRDALRPFAEIFVWPEPPDDWTSTRTLRNGDVRRARAVLGDGE